MHLSEMFCVSTIRFFCILFHLKAFNFLSILLETSYLIPTF